MYRHQRHAEAEESIYNLLPAPVATSQKPEMYRSKYPHDTPPTGSTFGKATATTVRTANLAGDYETKEGTHRFIMEGATMGSKREHYSDPTSFQQKQSAPLLPQPHRFEYTDRRKPPLNSTLSPEVESLRSTQRNTSKNFISENALAVIMADARRPVPSDVDFLKKPDFGKVPTYLNKVKQEISAEKEYIQNILKQEKEEEMKYQPKMRLLPEDERKQLVYQLKLKWEEVNKQYQTITHMVKLDTQGKIRRKEQYETELQSLEKAIEKLSKPMVFVHD